MDDAKLDTINDKIITIRELATALEGDTADFPALNRNIKRVLASVKMMELNLSDPLAIDLDEL